MILLVAVRLLGLVGAVCAGSARAEARGAAWLKEGIKAAGGAGLLAGTALWRYYVRGLVAGLVGWC